MVDRSRCMRMRFDRNECPVCTSNCHVGAISLGEDIEIDAGKCTLCMVCVSECPADCFDIQGADFFSLLARLRKMQNSVPYPVLGCKTASGIDAHEKTACLGALSEEHLIAIYAFLDSPVQLNLTSCAKCANSFIVETLKERIADIREAAGIDIPERIVMVEDISDLRFQALSYGRRDFFCVIRNLTFQQARALFDNVEKLHAQSYSHKRLPSKRNILNTIIKQAADRNTAEGLLREYAYSIQTRGSCDNCFSCIGLCPTGALKSRRDESGTCVLFNASLCIGCGLCRDFCLNDSITLMRGYSGDNYFGYDICATSSAIAHKTERTSCTEAPRVR